MKRFIVVGYDQSGTIATGCSFIETGVYDDAKEYAEALLTGQEAKEGKIVSAAIYGMKSVAHMAGIQWYEPEGTVKRKRKTAADGLKRANHSWTASEDNSLLSRYESGMGWPEIASTLGRTVKACKVRLSRLTDGKPTAGGTG